MNIGQARLRLQSGLPKSPVIGGYVQLQVSQLQKQDSQRFVIERRHVVRKADVHDFQLLKLLANVAKCVTGKWPCRSSTRFGSCETAASTCSYASRFVCNQKQSMRRVARRSLRNLRAGWPSSRNSPLSLCSQPSNSMHWVTQRQQRGEERVRPLAVPGDAQVRHRQGCPRR